jgi:hypothetical protein
VYRGPSQSEIEYLALKFGEIRADELARTLNCTRCPMATDCPIAYCPDSDCRRLAPKGCLTAPAGLSFALAS